jgi:dihydrofolate reductase
VENLGMHLLGRRLYEVMLFWETPEAEDPSQADYELDFARTWRALPKVVYSRTLSSVEGSNTKLSDRDPVEEVRELKEGDGPDIGVGGAELASALTAAGLIDEYGVFVAPVVLGDKPPPFFAGNTQVDLELVETRTFDTGVVYLRYQRA